MTIRTKQLAAKGAFVGNELLIVLCLLALEVLGAAVLTKALHLGWLASVAIVLGTAIIVVVGLGFAFTPRKPR